MTGDQKKLVVWWVAAIAIFGGAFLSDFYKTEWGNNLMALGVGVLLSSVLRDILR